MLNLCFRNEGMINFVLGENQDLGVGIDVTDLSYNATDFETIPYPLTYSDIATNTASLLDADIIQEDNATIVFQYLVWGYDYSDETTRNYIAPLDLTSIGINDYTTYAGIMNRNPLNIEDIFLDQFPDNPLDLLSGNLAMRLYEDDINQIIYNEAPVGTAFAFPRLEDTGYEISYITIDGIYLDVTTNEVDIIIIMNLNGKLIAFKGLCVGGVSNSLVIETDFESLNYGSIVALDVERISVLEFLSTALSDITWIIADAVAETITFDFTTLFTDNATLQTFYATVNTTTAAFTSAIDDNGYIAIDFVFTP